MASLTSSDNLVVKEIFLRQPPPPFSCDIEEDWLPEVSDIISGNFHVMVDLTGDSESEVRQYLPRTQYRPDH